jgi:hypothetical protein
MEAITAIVLAEHASSSKPKRRRDQQDPLADQPEGEDESNKSKNKSKKHKPPPTERSDSEGIVRVQDYLRENAGRKRHRGEADHADQPECEQERNKKQKPARLSGKLRRPWSKKPAHGMYPINRFITELKATKCIDQAIDTADPRIVDACLVLGLSPDGCGGHAICCGGSHVANVAKRSGKGPCWKPNENPMAFLDKVERPEYLKMLRLLIAHKADLNKQAYRGPMNSDRGTAAHYVQNPVALYMLMAAGADMNATIGFNGKLVPVQQYLAWTGRSRIWNCAHRAFLG